MAQLPLCGLLAVSLVFLAGSCGSKVDGEHYAKIEQGMSVEEVKDVLGEPDETSGGGVEMPGGAGGSLTVMTWKDGDKQIAVTFANDKVTAFVKKGF